MNRRRAVFLDRDGVLIGAPIRGGKPRPAAAVEDFELLPGVAQSCAALRRSGFVLIVVTNQPDVVRGTQTRDTVEALNDLLRRRVPLDDIRVCYHDDRDGCPCRKPRPGLLIDAARDWRIELARSFMVGDRWKDVEAGLAAGCTAILIGDGYGECSRRQPHHRCASLAEATRLITHRQGKSGPAARDAL